MRIKEIIIIKIIQAGKAKHYENTLFRGTISLQR